MQKFDIKLIIIFFSRYSRRRLNGAKCTCNEKQPADDQWSCMEEARQHYQQQNMPVIKDVIHPGYVYPLGGSAGYTNPVMPLYPSSSNSYPPSLASYPVSNNGAGSSRLVEPDCWSQDGGSVTRGSMRSRIVVPSPPSMLAGGNNVIVNPLPPLPLQETMLPGGGDNNTTIIIKHNKDETDGNKRNVVINQVNDDTNTSIDVDPIYQEIGAATKQKIVPENDENPPKEESSEDANANTVAKNGQKKEIEYWQITAKEVVKFRPCTETFIRRNDV